MAENDSYQTPSASASENSSNSANSAEPSTAESGWHGINQGGLTTPIAPEGGIPAFPGNMDNDSSNNDYGLTTPIAPEGGIPAYPGNMNNNPSNNDYGISLPIAPEGGIPAYPGWTVGGPNFGISLPIAPEGGIPAFPGNNCVTCNPVYPNSSYGQVRFINASTNTFPVNFSIDGVSYATNFMFSHVSSYQQVSDGFHTVSVTRATGMQALLLQQTFPFTANQRVTMLLVDAKEGGLEMIQISDTGCNNLPSGYGCYRVVNASYSGSSFDVRLANGDTIFRNIGFTQVSAYKRAMAGSYTVYLTNSNFYSVIRELPMLIIGTITGMNSNMNPIASTVVNIQARRRVTSYIMGNNWSGYSLRMITVND